MSVRAMPIEIDNQRRATRRTPAVGDLDPAAFALALVVEPRNDEVKAADDVPSQWLGEPGRGHHEEVVAADVPGEVLRVGRRFERIEDRVSRRTDRVIATSEAVVVVVGLEVIDVDVHARQPAAGSEALSELAHDRGVARQTGQRVQIAQRRGAGECQAHARDELGVRDRLDEIVIRTCGEMLDDRVDVPIGRQQDHRRRARTIVRPNPRERLEAAHLGHREIHQDHVRALLERQPHPLFAVTRELSLKAGRLEHAREDLARQLVVLHDQHRLRMWEGRGADRGRRARCGRVVRRDHAHLRTRRLIV